MRVDPNSNISDSSDSHREKLTGPTIRPETGIDIERSDRQQSKACRSIGVSFDPNSNLKPESEPASEKHHVP
jgi:hypothetical protein